MQQHKIYLESSNSLEDLATYLSAHIQNSDLPVFKPVYIVTQTEGMNSWLKLQLAQNLGIAANIVFLKPNELVNRIYYWSGGRFSKALSANNIVWLIYKILGEKNFIERFPAVAAYYRAEGREREVKRMSLAEKIADLFDQYQVYRTDMIAAWNDGRLSTKLPEEEWQQYIWEAAKKQAGDLLPDKTIIQKFIEKELQNPDAVEKLLEKISSVYLFGISVITGYHLSLLQLVSETMPVHFLILNPAPSLYWYEDKSEKTMAFLKRKGIIRGEDAALSNPLLTNWGRIIQDTFQLLFKSEEVINSYEVISEHDFAPDSLLHKIQHSLVENLPLTETRITPGDLADGSLHINSSFSAFREVEALYNYLVYLVDQKQEQLSPRDIVVMVSDIELYSSYIRAIFDHAPYKFKYTIADEAYTTSDSVFNAMISIMEIGSHNFTAENVYRLLDFSSIRRKTGIENPDLIRRVIDEANIRFGIEGNFDDQSVYVSWKYGLWRIMYGICIGGGEEYGEGEESFYPLDLVESAEALDVIRFVHFVETLIHFVEMRRVKRSIPGWSQYLEEIFNALLFVPDFAGEEEALLLENIQNLNITGEFFPDEMPFDVFIHQFLPTLQGVTRSGAFAGGGITFCSLIPMRSIPFQVVALLGMNFDKLPRKNKPVTFNLMEKERRKGDRNVKENDKHLFLETLLSAGKYLYISYIGQNAKDNSELPASVLIDELLDFIEKSAKKPSAVRSSLITRQPLHNFSSRYGKHGGLRNYLTAADKKIISLGSEHNRRYPPASDGGSFCGLTFGADHREKETAAPQIPAEVDLSDFISFLKNPIKYFYNVRLEIFYADEEVTLSETEIFEMNKLEEHTLKKETLQLSPEDMESFRLMQVKTGRLPLKNMAGVVVQNVLEEMAPVRACWEELTLNATKAEREVYFPLGDFVLTGTIDDIYGEHILVVSLSKYEHKYLLEAYIKHLVASALGWHEKVLFISGQKKGYFRAKAMNAQEASRRLQELLGLFGRGHEEVLPFTLDVNRDAKKWEGYGAADFKKDLDKLLSGDFSCPYLQREWAAGLFASEESFAGYSDVAEKVLYVLKEVFVDYFE